MRDAARVWQSRLLDRRKDHPRGPCINLLLTSSRPSVLLYDHLLLTSRFCMYSSIAFSILVNSKNTLPLNYLILFFSTESVHASLPTLCSAKYHLLEPSIDWPPPGDFYRYACGDGSNCSTSIDQNPYREPLANVLNTSLKLFIYVCFLLLFTAL
jgi:hypothetical protein